MDHEESKILKRRQNAINESNNEQLAVQANKLGEIRTHQGRYEEALKYFKESLAASQESGDRVKRGCAHRMVGEAYNNLGNFEKALDHNTKYLQLVEKAGDILEQQRAWATIGRSQLCLGESMEVNGDEEELRKASFAAAKNAFQKSLVIANEKLSNLSKTEQALMKGRLIMNLGLVYEYQGEQEKALTQLQKAVEMFRCHDLYEDWCRALGSLGALKLKSGDCEGALKSINKGLEVAKRLPADEKVARTADLLSTQAEVFFVLGELSSAKHALHKAYKMKLHNEALKELIGKNLQVVVTALRAEKQLQEIDENNWVLKKKLHENIADCCIELKSYKKAIDHYKKMLECSETLGETGKALSAALVSLGETYKDYKQYDLALQYFEREHELWEDDNPKEASRSLLNVASVYKLKQDWAQQLLTLDRARTQAVISGNVKLQLEVLNDIAAFHRFQRDEKSADEIENDILLLRGDTASSQDTQSSQEQEGVEDIWEHTNIENLSSDASEDEDRSKLTTTRLRQRNTCKVKKNEKGETALHVACIKQNIGEVQKLLETGHPVNVQDNAGWTPLHEACNYGYVDIVEMLINKGANVNHKGGRECDGYTPLHDAACNGFLDVIEVLLDRGADATAKTYKKPYHTPYNILVNWYKDNRPLDELNENNYQQLCTRMKQALEKVGQSVSEDTEDSSSFSRRHSSALRHTQASFPEPGPSKRSSSPQPSSSTQPVRKRPSYENKAIVDLKRKNKFRITSDGSSHSEDDIGLARFGSLRRKADSFRNIISDDDDEIIPARRASALVSSSTPDSDVELEDHEEDEPVPARVKQRSFGDASATAEYSRVMDTLRGMHKHKGAEPYQMKTAKPALLHEEEMEPDWLDDDLGRSTQPAKKLKLSSQLPMITKPTSFSRRSSNVKIPSCSPSRSPSPMDIDADTEDIGPPSPPRKKASPIKRSPKKFLSPYKPSQKCISPVKLSQRLSMDQMDLQLKLKVQVNDNKFLVPVPVRDLTIGWLADEVAQRYYRLHGLLPKLSLQTKDGALLSSTDPISLLLSSKDGEPDELLSKVESLTLPPITSRYKEACQTYECGEDVHLLKCLEACQVTLTLELSNLSLERQSTPLLYALSRQHTLRELNLPGCVLRDTGLEKLCPVLGTLEQLNSLDLSCNNISSIGLTHLGSLVADGKSLRMLNSFNLSHNPLDSTGFALLGPIFDNLTHLTKLELRDCGLALPSEDTAIDNLSSFSLDAITELDISHNALGCQGLGHFFGRVDAWQLNKLNVSYTAANNQEEGASVAREVALLLQKAVQSETQGGSFSCLDISGCNLLDLDVYELLNAMTDCNIRVEHLVLSCNKSLTAITLRYLLQHNPCFKSLTLTGCPGLVVPMQPEDIPPDLNMLRLSTRNKDDAKSLSLTWTECKGEKADEKLGPGGLVMLSVK